MKQKNSPSSAQVEDAFVSFMKAIKEQKERTIFAEEEVEFKSFKEFVRTLDELFTYSHVDESEDVSEEVQRLVNRYPRSVIKYLEWSDMRSNIYERLVIDVMTKEDDEI